MLGRSGIKNRNCDAFNTSRSRRFKTLISYLIYFATFLSRWNRIERAAASHILSAETDNGGM